MEIQLLQALLHIPFPFQSMKRKLYTTSFVPWHWLPKGTYLGCVGGLGRARVVVST